LRSEGFGYGSYRLIKHLAVFGHPALKEDVQEMYIGTTEVLEQPGEHGPVLAIE
jgi:hypothetical protein